MGVWAWTGLIRRLSARGRSQVAERLDPARQRTSWRAGNAVAVCFLCACLCAFVANQGAGVEPGA